MKKHYLLALSCLLCAYGCSSETEQPDSVACVPECNANETCVEGVCEPNTPIDNVCDPACDPDTQVCENGTCVPKSCDPACDPDTQVCENGTCVPKSCDPACDPDTQVCENGTCVSKPCDPACDPDTQVCDNGTCVPKPCDPACDPVSETCSYGKCVSLCDPACDDATQICVNGTCEPIPCNPACDEKTQVCEAGVCVPKITDCTSPMCKDNATHCDDNGYWEACPAGTGCYLGNCIEGWNTECEGNICSEDGKRVCIGGFWSACGSIEACEVDEEGNAACVTKDVGCYPNSCTEDGAYYCSGGIFNKCEGEECDWDDNWNPVNCKPTTCVEGKCVLKADAHVAQLWQTCTSNADCTNGGVCIFDVVTSRVMDIFKQRLEDLTKISVSTLDARIPEGHGICSADCTNDKAACDKISGSQQFTCQVVAIGDSVYPPKDTDGLEMTLPFHDALDINAMAVAPYAALCRPETVSHQLYEDSFCKSCDSSSECATSEVCVSGSCLPKCESTAQCPLGFSCSLVGNYDEEMPIPDDAIYVCRPNSGTCDACLDLDGDGQGYGHCEKPGSDCAPLDPKIYYSETVTATCSHNIDDTNCNGKIDIFELLGTADHCQTCDDPCKVPEGASNMARTCQLLDDRVFSDKYFTSYNPNDASTYLTTCVETCAEGWADCDGNKQNGCEVQLVTVDANGVVTATADAKVYGKDMDQDGHGDSNPAYHQYCCGDLEQCYAMPKSHYNMAETWGKVTHNDSIPVKNPETGMFENVPILPSALIDDCDDSHAQIFGGNPDVCDGIDNDCDASTVDGQGATFGDLSLGDTCTLKNGDTVITTNGEVKCDLLRNQLYCHNPSSTGAVDNQCDGIDDDKDGLSDEDYMPKSCVVQDSLMPVEDNVINLCSVGVQICNNGVKECIPMYEPREYDFFGDNIDSNCDGMDYDLDNAVFVNKFGLNSESLGHDDHNGHRLTPVATLDRALELACGKLENRYCYDIFLHYEVGESGIEGDPWANNRISIPTFAQVWNAGLDAAPANIEDLYASCTSKGCANKKLYPGETYAPAEAVRVYGGFMRNSRGVWSKAEDKKSQYTLIRNTDQDIVSLISGRGWRIGDVVTSVYPMSVRFENIDFSYEHEGLNMVTNSYTTLGLSCGRVGCRHVSMINSTLTMVGVNGLSMNGVHDDSVESTEFMKLDKDGMNAGWWMNFSFVGYQEGWNKKANDYAKMHKDRLASRHSYYSSFHGNEDMDFFQPVFESYKHRTCPDGSSPRGGMGTAQKGSWVDVGIGQGCRHIVTGLYECDYTATEATAGLPGGKGGVAGQPDVYRTYITKNSHDDDSYLGQEADKTGASVSEQGGGGGHGYGGAGGVCKSCNKDYTGNHVGIVCPDRALANGGIGQSGGGGAGGYIHTFENRQHNFNDWYIYAAWGWAGTGGSGGCGGRAGAAGMPGESIIGLQLTPPKEGDLTLNLDDQFKMDLKPGVGGNGQEGQSGRWGGWRGLGLGRSHDYLYFGATAGGNGGSGGGGGGGAGGQAGEGIATMFVCNRDVDFDTQASANASQLKACGFNVPPKLANNQIEYADILKVRHGTNGSDGERGKAMTSYRIAPKKYGDDWDKYNNVDSPGAKGGAGGKGGEGDLAFNAQVYSVKQTSFK